jgi:hypothetical protein
MMNIIKNITTGLIKNFSNIPGWSTRRKLVIFLVDDWGSIRIPDKAAFEALQKAGIDCEGNRFNRYDTLESQHDLSMLFEILASFKDKNNNSPSFTALTTVANLDFDKIRISDYREYFYEPFTKTLQRYYGTDLPFNLWKEGIKAGIFIPQFHGREHINVSLWLKGLQNKDYNLLTAFNQKAIGVPMSNPSKSRGSYLAAFDFGNESEQDNLKAICKDGLTLFNEIFGYHATLFTSPCLIHNSNLEPLLAENGIQFIDRAKISHIPLGNGVYRKKYYRLGQRNDWDQFYITRNCMFEPNEHNDSTAVNKALRDMEISFRCMKPAIISSHRVNFVGSISPGNREHGLRCLKELLFKIKTRWPDAEFLKFSDLAEEIKKNN